MANEHPYKVSPLFLRIAPRSPSFDYTYFYQTGVPVNLQVTTNRPPMRLQGRVAPDWS